MDNDIVSNTKNHFESINFDEMSERWIDLVIESEFIDTTDNPMSLGLLFSGDAAETLLELSRVCEAWVSISNLKDANETNFDNTSMMQEETLWTYLEEMEISAKQIQAVVYFLCCKAVKSSSSVEEKEVGLLTAKFYLSCMQVPGHNAYSIYNSNLFRKCIECLQFPNNVDGKDTVYKLKHFEQLLPSFVLVLETLLPLLGVFHLGTDLSSVEFVIEKLSELVATEVSRNKVNFDLDFLKMSERERKHFGLPMIVTSLAYQGLSILANHDLNGEKDYIYAVILSNLNHHILFTRSKKAQTITVKFHAVKDNAVAFICHNLKDKDEDTSSLTLTTLKRLCMSVSDRADFRNAVSEAVFTIMFHLRVQDLVDLLQWLLLLVDASEAHHRVFALEMLGLLLAKTPKVNTDGLPEELEVYLTPVPLIFAIFTRCDDVAPVVRTKALGVISQHMTRALNVLTEMQEPEIFSGEVFEEDYDCDFNGDHRSFWYRFTSFKDMLEEIAAIFHRRVEDCNGMARRAALQALENVITFDLEYLCIANLKVFTMASKDNMIVMRKQTVQSLTAILDKYPSVPLSQEYWLRCVLPLVRDPEDSVQAKVLGAIEEKFLHSVFSDSEAQRDATFCLLRKMSSGEFLSFQRYLHKAFSLWKKDNKLRPQLAAQLEKSLGCGNDEVVWLYLSIFASFTKIPSKMCKLAVEEFEKPLNWESFTFMENILKVIGCVYYQLEKQTLESIRSILREKLEAYVAAVEILPNMIEILHKIEKHLNNENEFSEFATKMIKSSVDILSPFVALSKTKKVSSEDLAIKSFTIVKEFCHIFPANITPKLAVLLKQFVYISSNDNASASNKNVTPTLQAHAFAALGKISLQEENLATEILPLLAKELLHSEEDRIRNNVVIILIEMCKRYTSYADQYIPLICACFKDKRFVIRYQSITLLVGLLQEDYIKCKGPLLYCILSTIIDKKEEIQELGKFCLLQLLYAKKNSIFADHFVDSIFVFNHFVPPKTGETNELARTVKQLDRFALRYEAHSEKRMQIYRFMLQFMDVASKAYLVRKLCDDILSSVAYSVFPINKVTESMVKDCFAILSSTEIRAYDSANAVEEVEENELEKVVEAEASLRLLTLINPVIPVVMHLKRCVWESKSELLVEMVLFLCDILRDYKGQLDELLKGDKDLLKQVQYELNNEARQQEREAKSKNKRDARSTIVPEVSTQQKIAQLIQRDRDSLAPQTANASSAEENVISRRKSTRIPLTRDSDELMDVPSTSSGIHHSYNDDPLLSSTPRVVLKPLSKLDLPDISRIAMDVDSD